MLKQLYRWAVLVVSYSSEDPCLKHESCRVKSISLGRIPLGGYFSDQYYNQAMSVVTIVTPVG